jgi:hypothetical protein
MPKEGTAERLSYTTLDALGDPIEFGPRGEVAKNVVEVVCQWPRELGQAAMYEGKQTEVLLGLLDAGLTVDQAVEALIMHGTIPGPIDRNGQETGYRIYEHEEGWHIEPSEEVSH